MSQDWVIKSRARECALSGETFPDGASIYSCLRQGAEGYERLDICEAHWTDAPRDGIISFWRSVYHAPPPPSEDALKKETVETLLRQYVAKEDDTHLEIMYILAVMLERKRILIERDVQRRDDGSKVRIYEHKQTGDIFTIPDPELRLDQIGEVQRQVNELLGIPPPGAPPATPQP